MADKDVVKIVQGLQQAAANAYDGARDEDGDPEKVGLRREEGDFLDGHRLMDGVNVKIQGNLMILTYHSEISTKEAHDPKLKSKVEDTVAEVVKWLKKEYKKVTGDAVKLTKKGDMDMQSESTSKIRMWVRAQCTYEVGGLDDDGNEKRTVDKAMKDWISQGKNDKGY